ncbi:alpha/beta-hydrolase [Tilletiaria anomala UBC 951]|uniref:Alpha/beta-hydrolase n=1 Tax=Tilletiaria anomala (strain ATCC 24038 / CBS 436.72 / UBC 951) TaxID=1037660 RepID=A0A066WLC1_TILAU|nr:alpha/beta-hydrolase [Tilletiaria anomala UBC 951]KDN53358.1 alpha/beta-hydrolase [Tilletiaria anomala UBC 951]
MSSRHTKAPSSDPSKVTPAPATGKTVVLDFEQYPVPNDAAPRIRPDVEAVVVCHGLFGSKQNWRSLGRAMSKKFGVPVYALDLRNHGTSPHIEGIHYKDMAADVLRFLQDNNLRNVVLIGHSMGGKVSLALALSPDLPPGTISHLISVDMTPARGPISPAFEHYIEAMIAIRDAGLETRNEADKMLQEIEKDMGVRQFLLTNLSRPPSPNARTWTFRIPLDNIRKNISQIGDFPYDPVGAEGNDGQRPERKWEGKALFVKGSASKYVNRRNIPICEAFFPNMKLVTLETGHWVQAEKPNEFMHEVEKVLKES